MGQPDRCKFFVNWHRARQRRFSTFRRCADQQPAEIACIVKDRLQYSGCQFYWPWGHRAHPQNDPNVLFPWKMLAEKGFGNWYDDTTNIQMPFYFDDIQALRIIGYDTKDTTASIIAFKRHWLQDTTPGLTDESKKVLYVLAKKYL